MALTADETTAALHMLAEKAAERATEIEKYGENAALSSTDEEPDSSNPVIDSFYENGGNQSILTMTNFTGAEFEKVYAHLVGHLNSNWNVGRGKRCKYGAKDMLFMTLTVLKYAGQWDYMSKMFGIKGPTFEKMIVSFVKIVADYAYQRFVEDLTEKYTIEVLHEKKKNFKFFPYALYATDVTFQQTNRPSGNLQEAKLYYSGKHKLYGYKVEVSVLPNGLAQNCTPHVPGSIADIDVFYKNIEHHKDALQKSTDEETIVDEGLYSDIYPAMWAVIVDKGYQGLLEIVRAIHPKKCPPKGTLTAREKSTNREISSDRIIAENYFGRLCNLWLICGTKYRWKEEYYDYFFRFAVALTNMHAKWHPLRAEDGDFYRKYKARLYSIGEDITTKRSQSQKLYREKKKARLAIEFRSLAAARDAHKTIPDADPDRF